VAVVDTDNFKEQLTKETKTITKNLEADKSKNTTMASFTFIENDYQFDYDANKDLVQALAIDPRSIRVALLKTHATNMTTLKAAVTAIAVVGPRADRVLVKEDKITDTDKRRNIISLANRIVDFENDNSVRGTQVQAAFPDLILSTRRKLIKAGAQLQVFVDESVIPLEYQFPGSGPVIPQKFIDDGSYAEFMEKLSRTLSKGTKGAREDIVKASVSWRLTGSDKSIGI